MEKNNGLIRHLGKFDIPKPNQEKEVKEIEQILRDEFNIKGEVLIFGHDLCDFGARDPIQYDQLIICYELECLDATYTLLNGKLSKYGIKRISFACKNS